jgi:hypothetical protein
MNDEASFDLETARAQVVAILSDSDFKVVLSPDGTIFVPVVPVPVYIAIIKPHEELGTEPTVCVWANVRHALPRSLELLERLSEVNVGLTTGRLGALREQETLNVIVAHNLHPEFYSAHDLKRTVVAVAEIAEAHNDWLELEFGGNEPADRRREAGS